MTELERLKQENEDLTDQVVSLEHSIEDMAEDMQKVTEELQEKTQQEKALQNILEDLKLEHAEKLGQLEMELEILHGALDARDGGLAEDDLEEQPKIMLSSKRSRTEDSFPGSSGKRPKRSSGNEEHRQMRKKQKKEWFLAKQLYFAKNKDAAKLLHPTLSSIHLAKQLTDDFNQLDYKTQEDWKLDALKDYSGLCSDDEASMSEYSAEDDEYRREEEDEELEVEVETERKRKREREVEEYAKKEKTEGGESDFSDQQADEFKHVQPLSLFQKVSSRQWSNAFWIQLAEREHAARFGVSF
jgi:hypothetical protein